MKTAIKFACIFTGMLIGNAICLYLWEESLPLPVMVAIAFAISLPTVKKEGT